MVIAVIYMYIINKWLSTDIYKYNGMWISDVVGER